MAKSRHPLADDVLSLTERIAAAADGGGESQDAALLRRDTRAAVAPGSTVVVVGEQKRGKSSLINALVGRPGLLPVDVDVATSVHLCVAYGEQEEAFALGPRPHRISFGELREFGAVDRETGVERHPEVTGVEIRLPADVLEYGTELIDTPGVGGLLAGHSSITLAILGRADALLFVVDGTHELTESELRFLEQAAARVGTVLFVLTAVDRDPGWRTMLERNIALLGRHAPRFLDAPWFPVSSKFKSDADELADSDPAFAAELLELSGFAPLCAELRDDIGLRVHRRQLDDLMGEGIRVTTRIVDRLAEEERSLGKDGRLVEEIRQRQKQLAEAQDKDAAWRARLTERVGALDRALRRQAETGLVALRDTAHAAVAAGGRDMFTDVPRGLADGLRGLGLRLDDELHERMEAIVKDLSAEFGVGGVQITPAQLTLTDPVGPAAPPPVSAAPIVVAPAEPDRVRPLPWQLTGGDRLPVPADDDRPRGVVERVPDRTEKAIAGVGAVAKRGADGFGRLSRTGKTGVVAGAAAVVFGALYAVHRLVQGRQRGDLQAHIDRTVDGHRATLPPALQAALWQIHADLERSATARLADRQIRLGQELADAEAHQAAARTELEPRLAATRRRLGEAEAVLAEAEILRERLRG